MGMRSWEHDAERDNVIFYFSDEEKRSRKESLKKDFPVCNSAMYFTYVHGIVQSSNEKDSIQIFCRQFFFYSSPCNWNENNIFTVENEISFSVHSVPTIILV